MRLSNPFSAFIPSKQMHSDGSGDSIRVGIKKLLIPMAIIASLLVLFGLRRLSTEKTAYESFVENHDDIDIQYLDIEDTFNIWSGEDVGNDVNTLLSGGKLYHRNGIDIRPTKHGNVVITRDGERIDVIKESISYINVVGDTVLFRSDKTRGILTYDLSTKTKERFLKGNYGEVFVYNNSVFFIDIAKGRISSVDLSGDGERVVFEKPANTFVVCGDSLIILDNEMNLNLLDLSEGEDERSGGGLRKLASHVERFFINGDIVIESDCRILSFDTSGKNAELLYESDLKGLRLVGVVGKTPLIQEQGQLGIVVDDRVKRLSDAKYKLFVSPLPIDDGVLTVLAVSDGEDARPTYEVLKIEDVMTSRDDA